MSFGEMNRKETVIVSLHTADGLTGYGESSSFSAPMYTHETNDTCMYIQEHFIAPRLVGREFDTVEEFCSAYRSVVGNRMARTGTECAFWHLLAQRDAVSLKHLVGGTRSTIPVGESIGIKQTMAETLEEIEQRLDEGYVRIKVKIAPDWDTQLLAAIRERWPGIDLTADANAAYQFTQHHKTLEALDAFNLSMLEQPFGADDMIEHAKLQAKLKTSICLDESIESLADIKTADALSAGRIVNIKPGRVGGLVESIKIHNYAVAHHLGVMCGGTFETGIGRAFNIALASLPGFIYPADMSPYQLYFAEDIVEPSYTVKLDGHIDVPDTPGLGFAVREDLIEQFTTQKVVVR